MEDMEICVIFFQLGLKATSLGTTIVGGVKQTSQALYKYLPANYSERKTLRFYSFPLFLSSILFCSYNFRSFVLIHAYIHARYQIGPPVGRGTLEAIFNGCEVTLDRLGDEDIQGRLRIDDASMAWGDGMGLDSQLEDLKKMGGSQF